MASHSQRRDEYWHAKAMHAEQQAAAAPTARLAANWQRVAEAYRWIAYQQAAFGKWQPALDEDAHSALEGGQLIITSEVRPHAAYARRANRIGR